MFERLGYISANDFSDFAQVIIAGFPYDGTASYRSGSRFAPNDIRKASIWNLETYEPLLNDDLENYNVSDLGDLFPEIGGGPEKYINQMRVVLAESKLISPVLGLGGEHTITLPLVENALKRNPDLGFLVVDAHADLRESYDNTKYSHACVTRRVLDLVGPERIAMIGIRSGTKEEFDLIKENNLLFTADQSGISAALEKLGNRPLYFSIDLDGFDPTVMPGTGTLEEGGLTWKDFTVLLNLVKNKKLVGADIVELLPELDVTGKSTLLAARLARLLIILLAR